jgi:hypothetical protein
LNPTNGLNDYRNCQIRVSAGTASDTTNQAFFTIILPDDFANTTTTAPPAPTAPTCATPQTTQVGGGQSVQVTPSCANTTPPFNLATSTVNLTVPAAHGVATVGAGNVLTYANTAGDPSQSDTFSYTVSNSVGASNTVVVNIAVLQNQCTVPGGQVGGSGTPGPSQDGTLTAAGTSCSLRQVDVLPIAPTSLSMSEAAGYGNPDFDHAVLGGVFNSSTWACTPGPVALNGLPQTACGSMNPVTVINARGTDAPWTLTAQVGDFIDGTRGATDQCSSGRNIDQPVPNNHCISGDALGWIPVANILQPGALSDTGAVVAGPILFPPDAPAQIRAPFPPTPGSPRQNINSVLAPTVGLHNTAETLCSAPTNQSGGTYECDARLVMLVPASAAAALNPGYTAVMTLTLT